MGLKAPLVAGLLAALALASCNKAPTPPPAADGNQVQLRSLTLRERPPVQEGQELLAELVVIETAEAGLNQRIQAWQGEHCPLDPESPAHAENADGCLKLFLAQCQRQAAGLGSGAPLRCKHQGETKVLLNRDYLLGLTLMAYTDTGGAHGMPTIAYLTLDRRSGRPLALADLVQIPPETLQGLLEKHLRLAMNLPPQASLKAAGFFEDRLPVPENVGVDAEGLRFTYDAYDVAPYAMGQPNVRIPYAELAPYFTADSPLRRLSPENSP